MNRRNGMWLTVLCILAAGILTTSVISSYVRESTEAAMAAETETEIRGAQISVPREASVPEASLKRMMEPADAGGRERAEKAPQTAGGNGPAAPRAAMAAPETAAEQQETDETGMPEAEADMAAAETVKSPLDPAAPSEASAPGQEIAEARSVFTKEELEDRLEKATELSWQYQGSLKEENAVSAYAAAEQLWSLWDKELNLVYGSIRARMSGEEAEALRISELEWMKERDQAASKAADASAVPQNQTLESRKAMAEETRARCYELMEEYEEILERTPDGAASGS